MWNSFRPRDALALMMALILAVGIVFPALVMGTGLPILAGTPSRNDLVDQTVPHQVYAARSILAGRFPAWCPGLYSGLPMAAIAEASPFYPPAAVLYLACDPQKATAWCLFLHIILAGLGVALLTASLGAGKAGQFLAGLAASIGLWLPNHLGQFTIVQAAAWVPWSWLALDLWLADPTAYRSICLGLTGGLMALGGHPQLVHHAAVAGCLWVAARFVMGHPRRLGPRPSADPGQADTPPHGLFQIVLWAGLVLAIGSPRLFPMMELARASDRGTGSLQGYHQRFPPHPQYLVCLLRPEYSSKDGAGEVVRAEETIYVGFVPIVLAAGALLTGLVRRRETFVPLWSVLLGSLLMAYGSRFPFLSTFVSWVPGNQLFRFPQRYLWITSICLSVAGGLGFSWFGEWLTARTAVSRRSFVRIAGIGLLAATLFDLLLRAQWACPLANVTILLKEPEASLALRRAGARPERLAERVATWGYATAAAHTAPCPDPTFRVLCEAAQLQNFLPPERCLLWGWNSVEGYIGLIPDWTRQSVYDQHLPGVLLQLETVTNLTAGRHLPMWIRWAGRLGARWLASFEPLSSPRLRPVASLAAGPLPTYLYENLDWAGAAWVTHRAVREPGTWVQLLQYLVNGGVARDEVILAEGTAPSPPPVVPPAVPERVEISSPCPEIVRAETTLRSPGYLVLNVNYHPRWRVATDAGPEQRPARANISQMAVPLPAGRHTVVFRFTASLEWGCLLLSMSSLVLCLLFLFRYPARMARQEGKQA
jgi:hypothetical protein